MRIGFVTDALQHLPFEAMLDRAAELGMEGVEIACSGWTNAAHCDLEALAKSAEARTAFTRAIEARGLELMALNANGNQLHPVSGSAHWRGLADAIRVSGDLGAKTVCCMSGLPGGGPDDRTPNWITTSWPPETRDILDWQWNERLLPHWRAMGELAAECGVERFAIELHGGQLVYNAPTLLRLREEIGPMIGANLDPSHPLWMGADPLLMADALRGAIHHVHAKDTAVNPPLAATVSRLESGPLGPPEARAWSYVTLGYGMGADWWRRFLYRLRMNSYDGWLSIEHEDPVLSRMEGLRRSVELLQSITPLEASDYAPPAI